MTERLIAYHGDADFKARFVAEMEAHRAPPGPDRWKTRSRTFRGIADAMADQWAGWAETQERMGI